MADKFVFMIDLREQYQEGIAMAMEELGVDNAGKLTIIADLLQDKVKITITVEE